MNLERTFKNFFFRTLGKAGWARTPRQITLDLTHRCNLRCSFCFYQGGEDPFRGEGKRGAFLSFETLKERVIDRFSTPDYYLTGGEPFLYPELESLLRHLREKGKRVFVSTNGTLLTETWAEKIVREGLFEKMDISLHGPEEVHDRVSGVEGTFQKIREGVLFLHEWKKRLGEKRPQIGLACTIHSQNIPFLKELAHLAREWSVDSLTFGNVAFTSHQNIEAHKAFSQRENLKEDFSMSQLVLGAPEHGLTKEDVAVYIQTLQEIQDAFGDSFSVLPVPPYREEEIWRHYFDFDWVYRRECRYPWTTLRIAPSGKVIPCLGVIVGDIQEEKVDRIWNNRAFRSFRKKLYRAKLFPGCFRCCKLK
jgi:MoaA/NifB/PqqE/SkfB family radical SAM enzyme